jgi:hypothetical protein
VVLLHRARRLAAAEPASRIALTTYTTTLAASLESGLSKLDADLPWAAKPGAPGICISGVDSLVSKVFRGAQEMEQRRAMKVLFGLEVSAPGKILDADGARQQWESALAALRGWWGIEFVSLKTRGPVALLG